MKRSGARSPDGREVAAEEIHPTVLSQRIVVVGTGTGVGKTHVCCSLLWALRPRGAIGCKPVESGVAALPTGDRDADRLAAASGMFHVQRAPYHFEAPISPHLAARRAGVRIDLTVIRAWVTEAQGTRPAIVETAGGLFSPLAPGITNLDLARALSPAVVLLVSPNRLGVLHDITSTLGLASARGLTIDGLVLSAPETADASTLSNPGELSRLGIAGVLATFPRSPPDASDSMASASRVLARLEQHGRR